MATAIGGALRLRRRLGLVARGGITLGRRLVDGLVARRLGGVGSRLDLDLDGRVHRSRRVLGVELGRGFGLRLGGLLDHVGRALGLELGRGFGLRLGGLLDHVGRALGLDRGAGLEDVLGELERRRRVHGLAAVGARQRLASSTRFSEREPAALRVDLENEDVDRVALRDHSRGFSTWCCASSEMCTSPSTPGRISTKAPKVATFVTRILDHVSLL